MPVPRLSSLLACMIALLLPAASALAEDVPPRIAVDPRVTLSPVRGDADDPAIWIHPQDPSKSRIIGTDKTDAEGGLYVWDLDGKQKQYVKLDHPNNVDIRQGFALGSRRIDIAVVNVRKARELRVFEIDSEEGTLRDITADGGIPTPELAEPYGLGLYRRPSDGVVFVIKSSKDGAGSDRLHQYRLEANAEGRVAGRHVGSMGKGDIRGVVEGMVADDELGYLYVSDEAHAVRKFHADLSLGKQEQIAEFATGGEIPGDREGLGLYRCADGTGYLLLSSQDDGTARVYRREGDDGDSHRHSLVATIETRGAKQSDGLDVTSRPGGPRFPKGFLVKHHGPGRSFALYGWEDIAGDHLKICAP